MGTTQVVQLLSSTMKFVFPKDIYTIIGCFAGHGEYRLVFTLTPKRKELSTKILVVKRNTVYFVLSKYSWIPITMQSLSLSHATFSLNRLFSGLVLSLRHEGSLYEEDAKEMHRLSTTILNYRLRKDLCRPKYALRKEDWYC